MLVFVIPLKSSQVSKDWDLVSQLFERCLKSVCNQTSDKFRVIVVCHEKPNIGFSHPHITYIEVDYPSPIQQLKELGLEQEVDWKWTEVFSRDLDKGRKLLNGLAYADKFSPSHVMVVDADDCVSKNIVKFVEQNSNSNGWYIKRGYLYHENWQFLKIKFKDFNQICGSSVIIKYELYPLLFNKYHYQHRRTLLDNGIALEALPFRGAIYSVGNGENIYQTIERQNTRFKKFGILLKIANLVRYRRLTKSICNEFNFNPIV